MFLSRFWYLLVATTLGAAVAVLFIARNSYNRARNGDLETLLAKDRIHLQSVLRVDARYRLTALAPIALDQVVRESLTQASGGRRGADMIEEVHQPLLRKLRSLNNDLGEFKGEVLAAVDVNGLIVAQAGMHERHYKNSLRHYPLVAAALRGYIRDDVWVWDEKLLRMAARPVIGMNGQYAGAIVHGVAVDERFSAAMHKAMGGAAVAFFVGERMAAYHKPPEAEGPSPDLPQVQAPLTEAFRSSQYVSTGRSELMDISNQFAATYTRITGEAALLNAGFVVVRPRNRIDNPWDFAIRAAQSDVKDVSWLLVAGIGLLAFGFGILFTFFEADAPFSKLRAQLDALADRRTDRVEPAQFRGKWRRLVTRLGEALEKASEMAAGPSGPKKPDLASILGPAPSALTSPFDQVRPDSVPPAPPPETSKTAAYGDPFAPPMPAAPRPREVPPPVAHTPTVPPPAPPAPAMAATIMAPAVPPGAIPGPGQPPGMGSLLGPRPPLATMRGGIVAPLPGAGARGAEPTPATGGWSGLTGPISTRGIASGSGAAAASPMAPGPATTLAGGPGSAAASPLRPPSPFAPVAPPGAASVPRSTPPARPGMGLPGAPGKASEKKATLIGVSLSGPDPTEPMEPPEPGGGAEFEDATVIAPVPESLLEAAASGKMAGGVPVDEEAYFRSVYQEFVDTKRRCGETTEGLTYDKFAVTLRKNKESLTSRFACKAVRFQVYIKEGKAALKATPVRE